MVSIIIPAYNSERYIRRCLKSLMAQTYVDIEIIVINDGSTDNTECVINELSVIDDRIKYYTIENSGASVARNIGLQKAQGTYLFFVDSDDYIRENAIEVLVNKIECNKSDVVCMGHTKVYENRIEEYSFPWDDDKIYSSEFAIRNILNFNIKGYICDKFYRRDLWNELGLEFESGRFCEDWPIITKYIGNCKKVSFANESLYFYVQHEESRIHTSSIRVISDYDYAVNMILQYEVLNEQTVNAVNAFKTNAYLEIIHELSKISFQNNSNVYKMANEYNLPSYKLALKAVLINTDISFSNKIKYALWKMGLYAIIKKIFKN